MGERSATHHILPPPRRASPPILGRTAFGRALCPLERRQWTHLSPAINGTINPYTAPKDLVDSPTRRQSGWNSSRWQADRVNDRIAACIGSQRPTPQRTGKIVVYVQADQDTQALFRRMFAENDRQRRLSKSGGADFHAHFGDIVEQDLARGSLGGVEQGEVDSLAYRASIDNSVITDLLDELA